MTKTGIGERLKQLRLQHGYSQADVAKLLGIGRTTYLKYESEENKPTRKLAELCNLYGVTTDYLLGRVPSCDSFLQSPAPPITPQDRELLRKYHELDQRGRQAVLDTIEREHSYTAPKVEDAGT